MLDLSSDTSEWYTPPWLVRAARWVLGPGRLLDPCSCPAAQANVCADIWFSENGETRPWDGADHALVNPAGGKDRLGPSLWDRCAAWDRPSFWIGHNSSQLHYAPPAATLGPFIVVRRRIRWLRPDGSLGRRPTRGNFLCLIHGQPDQVARFRVLGVFGGLSGLGALQRNHAAEAWRAIVSSPGGLNSREVRARLAASQFRTLEALSGLEALGYLARHRRRYIPHPDITTEERRLLSW